MDKIKSQINAIVVFKATTLDTLTTEYDQLRHRICQGIKAMKDSKVFTNTEIEKINTYGINLLAEKYREAREVICNNIRESFKF